MELKNTVVGKLLLASCAEDMEDSTNPNSPLHFAILNNDTEIIEMLRDNGANMNAENFNGKTALHDAVEGMKIETIDAANRSSKKNMNLLSSRGATVDDNGKDAVTSCHIAEDTGEHSPPLHLVSDECNEELTKLSLSKGANVNAKEKDGKTALHIATENGRSKIVELLLTHGADVNSACTFDLWSGYTSLHIAAEKGNKEMIKLLLHNGANVNARIINGITPLNIATEKWDSQSIEILINAGAEVNSVYSTKTGNTLLHRAVEKKHEQITKLCLSKGANVNAKNQAGKTPLHIATEEGHSKMVELLLKRGAEVNSACSGPFWNGYTSLHIAVKNGNEEIIKLLLDNGAECKR